MNKDRNIVKPVKATGMKPSSMKAAKNNGRAQHVRERDFLKERLPNPSNQTDGWHVQNILEFWAKPYDELGRMFNNCDKCGLDRRVLSIAREDIQFLIQILYKGGSINANHK